MPNPVVNSWPVHFATKSMKARALNVRAGDPFPLQDRASIRGYGAAYGVPDAHTRSFSDLGFVTTLDVRSEDVARQIREQRLSLREAQRLVQQGAA